MILLPFLSIFGGMLWIISVLFLITHRGRIGAWAWAVGAVIAVAGGVVFAQGLHH